MFWLFLIAIPFVFIFFSKIYKNENEFLIKNYK